MKKQFVMVAAVLFVLALAALPCAAKTFVIPHILESSGRVADTPYSFDTQIFATYTPGLAGMRKAKGDGANLDLYLYDDTGGPLQSAKFRDVCNPCSFSVGASKRKLSLTLDDLIVAAGGFPPGQKVVLGFGVIIVGGSDPDGVQLQGFVVNAHTSPFDLSVFGFTPEEVKAATP